MTHPYMGVSQDESTVKDPGGFHLRSPGPTVWLVEKCQRASCVRDSFLAGTDTQQTCATELEASRKRESIFGGDFDRTHLEHLSARQLSPRNPPGAGHPT